MRVRDQSGLSRHVRCAWACLALTVPVLGVRTAAARHPHVLVAPGTQATDGSELSGFDIVPGLSDGRVAFRAAISGPVERSGVYIYEGRQVRPVVREGDAPDGGLSISSIFDVVAERDKIVASVGFADDTTFAMVASEGGRLRTVVRPGDPTSLGVQLAGWDTVALRGGEIVFIGTTTDGETSIFSVRPPGPITSILPGARLPDLGQQFGVINSIAASKQLLVFRAENDLDQSALVASVGGRMRTVVSPGDGVPGFPGRRFWAVPPPAVRGQRIAFAAALEGREPGSGFDAVWEWARGNLRRLPGTRHHDDSYSGDVAVADGGVVAITIAITGDRERIVCWDAHDRRTVLARVGDSVPRAGLLRGILSVDVHGDRTVFVGGLNDHLVAHAAILTVPGCWRRQR